MFVKWQEGEAWPCFCGAVLALHKRILMLEKENGCLFICMRWKASIPKLITYH